ncbi:hypothetical protein D2V08_06065 [Flagellimonas lutimaris]|uniref:Carboxypeptidase regulatory-like domain-containing protein n=1 Tax=Flagellimonas lutimaris TaxID=475082 RepID=A0A3A1N7L9_9FLAO|nr:hypothetical protein [Allomuricauda lutimaris]RIV34931.1 hypothetical protein D2V08_06065 [Allomuricauda lutimaris]
MFHYKNIITFPFFLTLFFAAFGQEARTIGVEGEPLLENIHLHLNKTAFFKGERLWFKAYVQDQRMPSSTTTNLHVGVFSKDGKALVKKMFFVNNGISYGDFKIDSTFVEDSYTLMAWTNYMKNFEVATPFLQKIIMIGNAKQTATKPKGGITALIHPEGQQIVADTYNSIGLMVYNQTGNPIQTVGIQLMTEDGAQIQSNIQTNELGQGRFGFFADPTQSYFLKIKDGKGLWTTKKLEINIQQGIGISVDNTGKEVVVLSPKWSNSTLNTEETTGFSIAIFNNINRSFIYLDDLNRDNDVISVNRNQIPNGINTAVILDEEMHPISQRMFFNKQTEVKKVHSVYVSYCLTKNQDSLQIDLILPEGSEKANVSMSVLPVESSAHFPNNSISSSFLVQPYLDQQFIDGNYFFEGNKRLRDYQMDTRLLMEKTEKFNGYLGIGESQNNIYEFEKNIAIDGKILDADTKNEKQVSIMSQSFGAVKLFDLASDKRFYGSLPLFEGDSVLISVLDRKGKLRKPKAELYFNNYDGDTFDYTKWLRNTNQVEPEAMLLKTDEDLNLTDRTISLDEVVVSERAKQNTKFQITANIERRIIDKETIKRYTFESYIRRLGFRIYPDYDNGGINVYVSDPPGIKFVPVLIEGMLASPGELISRPLSSIKSMVYSKNRLEPFISLSLRYDYDELYGREGQFTSIFIPKGFSRTQTYFTPNYPDYTSFLYKKYGAIWWESQLEVNSEAPYSITVPLNEQKEVKVVVEGMTANGLLYHTEQTCSPFENNYSAN